MRDFAKRTKTAWSAEQIAVANGLDSAAVLEDGQLLKTALLEPFWAG